MEYDLILKGGTVVLDWGDVEADVALRDGKIVSIGSDLGRGKEEIRRIGTDSHPWEWSILTSTSPSPVAPSGKATSLGPALPLKEG